MTAANAARGRTNRGKGNEAERAAARWLTAEDWPTTTTRNAERGAGRQSAHGDLLIADAPHVITDVKNTQYPLTATWLEQLGAEADDQPHQVLLWKHPQAAMSRPGEWLAIVADDPLSTMPRGLLWHRPLEVDALTMTALSDVLGWLTVEHTWRDACSVEPSLPALTWWRGDGGGGHRCWLLMRASTWATEVLPCWEGTA